ncbi:MAG: nucleoid occlusion factor SlmA [Burkholderiales bacterium]|nr:nucleoid occlusion factor SlmA [Burkholderiales bacterium]
MTHTAQTSKPLATQSSASNSAKGERRVQILQMLAQMLEHPEGEKITTAGLAKRLEVSEAALYRHFASKAQMFEGLIEFIETSVVGLLAQINQSDANAMQKIQKSLHVLLAFAQKNPGMARVLIGDALLHENPRLQARVTQLIDRVQASLKQSFRDVAMETGWQPVVEVGVYSEFWMSWVVGRWHAYVRSGFKVVPTEHLEATWTAMNIF